MIKPHGSETLNLLYVEDDAKRAELEKEAAGLPSIVVSSPAAANAVMMGSGYFNPLTGYMNVADGMSCAGRMTTQDGLFFPVPVMNLVNDISAIKDAKRIALLDPNVDGNPVLAIQTVEAIEEVTDAQMAYMTDKVYRTDDEAHPGVKAFNSQGKFAVSGPIEVLNYSYFATDFPGTFKTAKEIRDQIEANGWNNICAFQTRNPMHRAHEELVRMCMDRCECDGAVIHMLLGKLKAGDIPADVRDAAIRKMVELYFPPNSVEITGYGFDMLYAGPREAVLHALFRQNMGCTWLIVGRDHAGVGDYYGPFDAQDIFDYEVPVGAMEIKIFKADHTAYSRELNQVIMLREAPEGHKKESFVFLSGTKVREMLSNGEDLPVEFARPEVAKILGEYYQSIK